MRVVYNRTVCLGAGAACPAPTRFRIPMTTTGKKSTTYAPAAAAHAQEARGNGADEAALPGGPAFTQIKVRRTFEDICQQIRSEVAAGRLKPGDRLPA